MQPHDPRQIGARNGLVRPHQIERNLPVDLPRCPARRYTKIFGVDLSHRVVGVGTRWVNFVSIYNKSAATFGRRGKTRVKYELITSLLKYINSLSTPLLCRSRTVSDDL